MLHRFGREDVIAAMQSDRVATHATPIEIIVSYRTTIYDKIVEYCYDYWIRAIMPRYVPEEYP